MIQIFRVKINNPLKNKFRATSKSGFIMLVQVGRIISKVVPETGEEDLINIFPR